MTLPKDLKQVVKKTIYKRIKVFVIASLIIIALLVICGDRLFNTTIVEFKVSCYIIALIIPFVISGIPLKLIDKSYCGEIVDIYIDTTTDNSSSSKPTLEHLYTKNTIYLSIMNPNGKVIRKKAYEGRASLQQYLDTYKNGDRVFHLYGSNQVIILPRESDTHVQCAVCGDVNEKKAISCRNCGHTLIKQI